MISVLPFTRWIFIISVVMIFSCQRNSLPEDIAKIQFDMADIDASGLKNGEIHVDYEFCIPATQASLNKVLKIEPETNVMTSSRGRVGCTEGQWLCIVSTRGVHWKDKLNRIAQLPFVKRIIETHYE